MLLAGWGPCGIDVEDADDEFLLATDSAVTTSGRYYLGHRPTRSTRITYEKAAQDHLWSILEQQCKIEFQVK